MRKKALLILILLTVVVAVAAVIVREDPNDVAVAGERLFLPLEDESSRVLLPVLHGIAALTRSKQIEVVFPDLSRAVLPRWRAALASGGAVGRPVR